MKIKARDLKRNDLVWIAGMLMLFSHFDNGSPVFNHYAERNIQYIDRNKNGNSLIEKA